MHQTGPVL